jgi:RND family efflux transporter MFP subunit
LNANVGDYKSAGSVIAEIDSELRKATLLNAQAMYEKAQSDADRIELLYKENAATLVQLEQVKYGLQAAQAQLIIAKRQVKDTKIITPINGVISMKMVDKGAIIGMNAVIANIIDISSLKVKVNVSERDAFTLKKADKVNISTDVYPGKTFTGTVAYISSKADEAHTYPVEISLANSSITPLKAGMFARITFSTIYKHQILTIPRNALLGSIKDPKVFIANGNKAELRKLIIGAENGYNIEILGGLQAGDIIIVDGQNNLKDGTKISVVNH